MINYGMCVAADLIRKGPLPPENVMRAALEDFILTQASCLQFYSERLRDNLSAEAIDREELLDIANRLSKWNENGREIAATLGDGLSDGCDRYATEDGVIPEGYWRTYEGDLCKKGESEAAGCVWGDNEIVGAESEGGHVAFYDPVDRRIIVQKLTCRPWKHIHHYLDDTHGEAAAWFRYPPCPGGG